VALDAYRDACVRRIVLHAYRNVAHYRELLDRAGVDPRSIRSVADLVRVPTTSKQDLQDRTPRELVARGFDPDALIVRRTTGSTGQRLEIRRTWAEERLLGAFRWRALRSMGARLTDRYAEIEEVAPTDPRDRRLLHAAFERVGLLRQRRISALDAPGSILAGLRAFCPDVIGGYAGVLAHVAEHDGDAAGRGEARAGDRGGDDGVSLSRSGGGPWRPRFVATHSDTLTARMRARIASAFDAPVYELYDCNECNVIAWECTQTGDLHVADDALVVEVLVGDRRAQPGERGEVVLTTLHSRAMPFVRYRIGDLVAQGESACACGRPYSTIRAVHGRMFDYFPLPDGREVHPYEIIAIFDRAAPWLVRYRLVQQRRDFVTATIVAKERPAAEQVARLRREIEGFLGPEVVVRVEVVDELAAEGTAKLRVCRSLVASAYDAVTAAGDGGDSR
jgi:phenylacetate-CoA ligase